MIKRKEIHKMQSPGTVVSELHGVENVKGLQGIQISEHGEIFIGSKIGWGGL